MVPHFRPLLLGLLFCMIACARAGRLRESRIPITQNYQREFNYISQSGQDWESGQCRFGRKQSPVDFPAKLPDASGDFKYRYGLRQSQVELSNSGYIYLLDMLGAGYGGITYNKLWFPLMTITVHAWSEHTVGGEHTPAELHLVHKNDVSTEMVVVAIPLNSATAPVHGAAAQPNIPTDANFNAIVQPLVASMPQAGTKFPVTIDQSWDLNALFNEDVFLTYSGSLTKPPCTEIVTWFVKAEPVMVSDAQAQLLHNVIYGSSPVGNARASMPLNGRPIGALKAAKEVDEAVTPSADDAAKVVYGLPPTDREVVVRRWTQNALKIAEGAVTQTAELDAHARAAAEADVRTLAIPFALSPMAPSGAPGPAPAPVPVGGVR